MENKNVKYFDMVAALVKDGGLILESLTPAKCNALHMAVGIAGETSEMLECVLNAGIYRSTEEFLAMFDRENATEENGDLEFYMEGLAQELERIFTPPEFVTSPSDDPLRLAAQVAVSGGKVLDMVKRWVIYDKDEFRELIAPTLAKMYVDMAPLYDLMGITRKQARDHNIGKLLSGEKARYKLGKYTDQQAVTRADKVGV